MECVGPIIVLLIAVAQIYTQVKKNQEQARRRALGGPPGGPQPERSDGVGGRYPPARRPPPQLEPEPELVREEEIVLPEWREPEPRVAPAPEWVPPRPVEGLIKRKAARATVPLGEAVKRRKVVRFNHTRLRNAILMFEIMGPPVALRDPSPRN